MMAGSTIDIDITLQYCVVYYCVLLCAIIIMIIGNLFNYVFMTARPYY